MNWRKISIYFFFPLAITIPMILMYFSNVPVLQHIVSPEFEGIFWHSNREFGLLENLQHVTLFVMFVIALRAMIIAKGWGRAAVAVLAAFILLVFMEELDWGRHYYEFFTGVPEEEAREVRNWHNVGSRTELTKIAVSGLMVALFLVAPTALAGSAFPLVRLLTPDKYAGFGLAAMLVASATIYALEQGGFGTPGTLDRDLNEFREILTYYLFAAFLFDVFERRLRGKPHLGDANESDAIALPTRTAPAQPQ